MYNKMVWNVRDFVASVKWLLAWAKVLWSVRELSQNGQFNVVLNTFAQAHTPLAAHAKMYLDMVTNAESVSTHLQDGKITITIQ